MKTTLQLKLAALIIIGTASSLLGSPAPQNFEFQWETTDSGFSPTFLNITAALGIQTSAAMAITSFEITTPNGVWTPTAFTPTGGSPLSPVSWQDGSMLTVSGTTAAPVLTFAGNGDNLDTSGGTFYQVNLQTSSMSDSIFIAPTDDDSPSTGTWVPVLADAGNVPETSDSLMLLLVSATGLCVYQRFQSVRA